ncbi:MAG TPA: protein ndvB, partial [Longimicrobiales bacterium]|nr:protein ndvB [Longimicrobiales bacterium]
DEYVVRPEERPPAPWCNVIANEGFGCLTSEAALGSSWSLNAGENRLTPWHNDPVLDPPSEALYLRDEETGRVWSTTPRPAGPPALVRHGQGYTRYRSASAGLEHELTVFVPPHEPVKVATLEIRNATSRPRRITATYYAEWVLGTRPSVTRPYVFPDVSTSDSCLLAETSWSIAFGGRVAFLASDKPLHGYTADRVEMLGVDGGLHDPAGLRRWGLSGRVRPGLDPCGALQVHIDLEPGASTEVAFFVGQAADKEGALDVVRRLRRPGGVAEAWASCRAYWDDLLGGVRFETPDAVLDQIANRWLPYQTISSRFFGRTGFYQSSGAYGFRDQLQDSLLLLHCAPALARRHILESAAHQFEKGDVLHWWHPPSGAGVRTRCSDDLLWLVYVTYEYVRATGDSDVLLERVPFLVGAPLSAAEHSRFATYAPGESASLLEHCRRALTHGFTEGPHGLPLIGHGDWNDGMDAVGREGRGESVWLGWFVHACAERFADLLECLGAEEEAGTWRGRLPALSSALHEHGWDGRWYRRAYYDDGTPIGSAEGEPPEIDSIAQSWAVLSGAGRPAHVDVALDAVEDRLVWEQERLVLLLTPPFRPHGHDPGYIAAYPPGVRENGGQYTHAGAWLGLAHAVRGDGSAAHRIASLLNPLERTRTRAEVERYRVEPYVIAADIYGVPPFVGRGGWTWYTGSAAWLWRLTVEGILGLRRRGGALEVEPCLPDHWPGFEARVRAGAACVHVRVHNEGSGRGVSRVTLDGRSVERARVELSLPGERSLEVWVGSEPVQAS